MSKLRIYTLNIDLSTLTKQIRLVKRITTKGDCAANELIDLLEEIASQEPDAPPAQKEEITIKLENWKSLSPSGWPRVGRQMFGEAYGHPLHRDGKEIVTSRVIAVAGSRVTTRSGSHYVLGKKASQ